MRKILITNDDGIDAGDLIEREKFRVGAVFCGIGGLWHDARDICLNAHGAVVHNDGTTTFNGCNFTGNSCDKGGAMSLNGSGTVNINGGSFTNNEARLGGVIYTSTDESGSSSRTLNIYGNCTFSGNHATSYAGVIHFKSKGELNVTDCTFSENYSVNGDSWDYTWEDQEAGWWTVGGTYTGTYTYTVQETSFVCP